MTLRSLLIGLASLATATSLAHAQPAPDAGVVNIYSSRHYDTDLALYDDFTAQTGIRVNRIEASADALIARISAEGEFSPADILVTVDAGRLWRAEEAGLFQPVQSDTLTNRIPAHLRHPDGLWFGLSTRARVIIYNKEAGAPAALDSYADLADPAYQGQVCMRSSSNIYNISLLAAQIEHEGSQAAQSWVEGVVANFARPPQSNDTGNIRAVASGECAISMVNTYYLARLGASEKESDRAIFDQVGVIFPDQDGRGTHVNISGAGVLTHAPNRDNAIRFIEYLTDTSAQAYFANGNQEYPAVIGVKTTSAVEALGDFKSDQINASALGRNQTEAVQLFDRGGWQ